MTHGCKIDKQDGAYFLTFTVVEWKNVFLDDRYKLLLCDSLNYCVESKGLEIFSYVLMSTHMHLLARAIEENLSSVVRDFKKFTSGKIIFDLQSDTSDRNDSMLKTFSDANKNTIGMKSSRFGSIIIIRKKFIVLNLLFLK